MVSDIEVLHYNEAIELPRFKASLDRLLNKRAYDFVLTVHDVSPESLAQFVEKAVGEGNAVLIEREWNGFMVVVWKDSPCLIP